MKSVVIVLLLASTAAAQPAPRDVDITAPDGTSLTATYFAAGGSAKPAVMLMHMCVTTRKSWEPVATLLNGAGINVLTIDNRGFGQSGGPRYETATPDVQREVSQKWPADFDAAFAWLVAQPGIDKRRIGAGGASCGVSNAVQLASRHPEVRSLVLLAGPVEVDAGTRSDGLDYLLRHPWLPIFTSAAADDQYDAHFPEMMQWIAEITGNPRNKFVGFKDGRHGTEIFGPHPELTRQISAWFEDTLVKSPANPSATFAPTQTPISEFWSTASQRGGAVRATQLFHDARTRDPNAFLFPEFQLNLLAYRKLQSADKADTDDGLGLFKLIAEAYPASSNAQDSLADGYTAIGQNDLALAAEQKCLELLPADTIPEAFKVQLRKIAEDKIAKLKAKLH